ncbi:MAG TPA: autotransporter assembly complex family protein [Pararhizobium sp.]|uniref:autotransporter assembly complex protein TamA n=1 Tax=Pararhizobium sp. TaxID=1977563 RepID=UPI002CF9E815|nr:autotransporter assembly complex family protein [Pararhizobium sp.]HTO31224.1 autotransporter assembly complex family protein [Pararhizobium sp.]
MRKRMRLPIVGAAYRKVGTAFAVAALVACGPLSASNAYAFKIFGMRFFENEEEKNPVVDPVNYSLTLTEKSGDDDLKDVLENSSRLFQDKEEPVSGNLGLAIKARDDRDRLLAALYEQARYGGVVTVKVNGQDIDTLPPDPVFPNDAPVPVEITVTPGPVFTLGEVVLKGDAVGKRPDEYLKPGNRADSTLIIKAGEKVVEDLKEEGRPLARLTDRSVVADHATNTVDVIIAAEGGPVAPVGAVSVTGTKTVDPEFVAEYSRLNGGDLYSPEEIRKASERLRQLGVFSSITIKEATVLAPDGTIPMTIEVSEGKHRYVGAGAQYSTTDGFGIQGYWGHRNLFGRAESLRLEGSVSRIGETTDVGSLDYSAGLIFAKPGAFGPTTTFNASLKAQLLDPDAYKATIFTGAAGVTAELSETDTISAGGELQWADVEDAFGTNEYLTASIPIEYIRDTRDNKLNPTEGYRASINAKPSYEINGQAFFSSFEGSASAYLGLGEENRVVLAGRLGVGVLAGGDGLASIPANRRFYLGGGGTVRGYSYQEISPRNGDDEILGGRSYVNATVEARIGITEKIGLVPFIDVGTVSAKTAPDFSDLRAGAGLGLRYNTPFGPIRLDVALPLNAYPDGTKYGIYAGIGQSF